MSIDVAVKGMLKWYGKMNLLPMNVMELIVVVFLLATIEFKGNSNWIEGDDKRAADSFLFDCCKDMRNDPIKITRNQLKLSQCCPDFSVTSYFIFALQFRRYFYSEIQNFSVDSFTRLIGLWNGLIAVVLLRIIGFMEEFGKKIFVVRFKVYFYGSPLSMFMATISIRTFF